MATAVIRHTVGDGRYYTASQRLRRIAVDARSNRTALTDPYPWLSTRLRAGTS